jgi:iron(II)-dependent oxidoreductase
MMTAEQLIDWVVDARRRTCDLIEDLSDADLVVPPLPTLNPTLWELGHVAWFQENWVLRGGGRLPSFWPNADALYDSAAVPHDARWDLPLTGRTGTLRYLHEVRDRVVERLQSRSPRDEDVYFTLLSVFHEDMHGEALTYTRQTLSYPTPQAHPDVELPTHASDSAELAGDVELPGGTFQLGATPEEPFIFDNEKWAHPVEIRPFAIARTAVTQAQFAGFVDAGGYERREFWTDDGWTWRMDADACHPVYWRQVSAGAWERGDFDRWVPLEPRRPVLHVNWHEANAYCRWAKRRLPTEAEWELAAAGELGSSGRDLANRKRRFPWGAEPPTADRANLDSAALGCIDVNALPHGDSAFGCRQMTGNVWEWTADTFLPYPGFRIDPYKEYSAPWFGTHKVLRGGSFTTPPGEARVRFRNFYTPDRADIFCGFRTCAA